MIQVNDQLCLAGGKYEKILAWYSPLTDTWSQANAKPQFAHQFGATLHQDNKIIILGGNEMKSETFDMDTEVWSVCDCEMPTSFYHLHGLKLV